MTCYDTKKADVIFYGFIVFDVTFDMLYTCFRLFVQPLRLKNPSFSQFVNMRDCNLNIKPRNSRESILIRRECEFFCECLWICIMCPCHMKCNQNEIERKTKSFWHFIWKFNGKNRIRVGSQPSYDDSTPHSLSFRIVCMFKRLHATCIEECHNHGKLNDNRASCKRTKINQQIK